MKHNPLIIILFSIILIICWFGYINTEEINKISNTNKPLSQQLYRFIWLILVGLISYIAFLKSGYKLVSLIILIIYFFAIFILGILGTIEYKWHLFTENQKELISGVRLFLSSPLPFIISWLLIKINWNKS